MKRLPITSKILAVSVTTLAFIAIRGMAQTAPAPDLQPTGGPAAAAAPAVQPSPSPSTEDQPIVLDPFSVTAENEGYQAVDTLGGARVRTKLTDTPSALSVVTVKFMQDLGITNALDLLIYTPDTDVAGLGGDYSGVSSRGFGVAEAGESQRLDNPGGVNRARGLTAMDNTRNYFVSEIPWDSFDISRVDISRGPNSFLFGVGSPSGIANVSTNEAMYKDEGSVAARTGSFGSTRETLDYNKVLVPNELALRIDLVDDDTQYQENPAFNHTERAYGALRFDPKIFATDSSHMKIEANYEAGQGDSNNPRELPPLDFITGYFSGINKAGYDPYTYNPQTINDPSTGAGSSFFDANAGPWVNNGDMHYAWGNNATYYFNGANGELLQATQGGQGGESYPNGPAGGTYSPAGFNGVNNVYHLYTNGFAQYAINENAINPSMYPGANAGTVTYLNKTLSDPSIFDFYNRLIDGRNKQEWQNWNAFNVNVEESLLNGHLAIQAVADHENYSRGQQGLLIGNMSPYISVDLDAYALDYPSWLPGASTNPYEGMPFVANDVGSGNNSSTFINDNYQVSVAGSLDFEELMPRSLLAKFLGHHELTALGGVYITKEDDRDWQEYATDPAWGAATNHGLTLADNNINWVSFLGPSLAGMTSAAGAHLSNMSDPLIPTTGPVTAWNGAWTAGSSVDPTSPWTDPEPAGAVAMTQADNPANYAGYQPLQANVLNSKDNLSQLYTQGDLSEQKLSSIAVMYQGYFWDDTIIPEVGVRRDEVLQRGDQAPINPTNGVASMNYGLTDPGVTLTTTSTSYGVTLHLPKMLRAKLPEGTDISLYYFHGNNETPKVRYSIDGSPLPSETGKTDDYTIRFDALHGHATLKLTAFKTVDDNATASYGQPLGAEGYLIDSLPTWTLGFAAAGEAAVHTPASEYPADFASNSWLWGWATSNPAAADQIGAAIQKYFPTLFPQSYWNQYGLPVSMANVAAGNWMQVFTNQDSPLVWNVNNSHLIHGVNPTIDQNIESKGYELEATIRPVLNWDLTFNASRVNAFQTALGADAANYLNGLANIFLNTPIGLTPMWGGALGGVSQQFLSGLWAPYLEQVALTGTQQPELSKWNFRGVTTYTFDRGWMRGIDVGGAYRWQSAPILGYGIEQSTILGTQAWINDVNKPLYGLSDYHFDAWIGYQHKVTSTVDWKLQLNLQNVGEKPHLTPVSVEPDGTFAQQRIEEGQVWQLTNTFTF
ncbi:MAG: TonB-dependent receptor plug domain-containing protein [Opitutaceae bacterium]